MPLFLLFIHFQSKSASSTVTPVSGNIQVFLQIEYALRASNADLHDKLALWQAPAPLAVPLPSSSSSSSSPPDRLVPREHAICSTALLLCVSRACADGDAAVRRLEAAPRLAYAQRHAPVALATTSITAGQRSGLGVACPCGCDYSKSDHAPSTPHWLSAATAPHVCVRVDNDVDNAARDATLPPPFTSGAQRSSASVSVLDWNSVSLPFAAPVVALDTSTNLVRNSRAFLHGVRLSGHSSSDGGSRSSSGASVTGAVRVVYVVDRVRDIMREISDAAVRQHVQSAPRSGSGGGAGGAGTALTAAQRVKSEGGVVVTVPATAEAATPCGHRCARCPACPLCCTTNACPSSPSHLSSPVSASSSSTSSSALRLCALVEERDDFVCALCVRAYDSWAHLARHLSVEHAMFRFLFHVRGEFFLFLFLLLDFLCPL